MVLGIEKNKHLFVLAWKLAWYVLAYDNAKSVIHYQR